MLAAHSFDEGHADLELLRDLGQWLVEVVGDVLNVNVAYLLFLTVRGVVIARACTHERGDGGAALRLPGPWYV